MATINHKTYNEATETFKDFNVYDGKEALIFKVDGSEGKVGIGTTNPAYKLDVESGNIRVSSASSGEKSYTFYEESGGPTGATIGYDGLTNSLFLGTTDDNNTTITQHLVIPRANGNVTIKSDSNAGGGVLNLENTTTAVNGQDWGSVNFISNDSSASASGIRASIVGTSTSFNGDGNIVFSTAPSNGTNTERMRILATGGLTFNGDTAAANALDDYEEGTWTPQISNGTTNVAISNLYSTYTKIGRQVTVNTRTVNGDLSSFSSGDNISFIGLPFTSGGDYYSTVYVRGAVSGNLVRLVVVSDGTTTASTDLLVSELVDDTTDYWFTITYFV